MKSCGQRVLNVLKKGRYNYMKQNREKLSMKLRLGYGIGQMSDSLPYNFIATYALFFLTDIAGIPVAFAGRLVQSLYYGML